MCDHLYSKKGFSLIEIIVAAIIMAMTIGGIFSVFSGGNRFVLRASRRLAAVNVAQAEIENRRIEVRYDTWNTGGLAPTDWTAYSGPLTLPPQAYRYKIDIDSSGLPTAIPDSDARCRRMFMRVGWAEPG
jgi:prepilin-type N-terminal cleavage/methylation domain-containing protein